MNPLHCVTLQRELFDEARMYRAFELAKWPIGDQDRSISRTNEGIEYRKHYLSDKSGSLYTLAYRLPILFLGSEDHSQARLLQIKCATMKFDM